MLLATFYKPHNGKNKIVMLESEFNSDILAAESWIDLYNVEKNALIFAKVSDRDPQIAIDNIKKIIHENQSSISIIALSLASSHFSHYYDVT